MMLSLRISFTRSAIGWSRPKGPTRLGPRRTWKRPSSRRSAQVRSAKTPITALARISDLTIVIQTPSGTGVLRHQLALREEGVGHRHAGDTRAKTAKDDGRPRVL